jgi:predicted glycosyltransferase
VVNESSRPRLLFYCQHSLGLGHLARSLAVARGLAERFDVVLLNGGRLPDGLSVPKGVEVVNLPPMGLDPEDYRLVSHDPAISVEDARDRRRDLVLGALERVRPHVVLVEQFPFGRKKFAFELLPLLERATAAASGRPQVICSLRDILVSRRKDQPEYDERASQRANAWFDAILVHADPSFVRLEESFHPATPLRVPVHYTGFVAPPPPAEAGTCPPPSPRVLVSAGGGMVGDPLFRAAVGGHRFWNERRGLTTTIVTGPFVPEPTWEWLVDQAERSSSLDVVRHVDDLCAEMRRSAVSVSQCGYNTAMDILRAGTPAIVVPFSQGQEDEQGRRARRLAELGVLRVVAPEELDGARLARELAQLTAFRPPPVELDLTGEQTTARLVADLAGL